MVHKLCDFRHKHIFANRNSSDKRGLPMRPLRFWPIPNSRRNRRQEVLTFFITLFSSVFLAHASVPDIPFLQDRSEQFRAGGELAGATLRKVHVNKDGIVYVLTDRG